MTQPEHNPHPPSTCTHSVASSVKAKLFILSDNTNVTHQWVCTNQPNYIIIPCLSAVKTREGFVWPAGGMWYTWHFLAKGQLSGRQCQREERRVRSQLLVPTLAFFFLSLGLFLPVPQSAYLSLNLAL